MNFSLWYQLMMIVEDGAIFCKDYSMARYGGIHIEIGRILCIFLKKLPSIKLIFLSVSSLMIANPNRTFSKN